MAGPNTEDDRVEHARDPEKTGSESTGPDRHEIASDATSEATLVDGSRPPNPVTIDARIVALAAAVEALSDGHARVLAGELRRKLEALAGPMASVTNLADKRPKR